MSRGIGRVQRAVLDALLGQPSGPFSGWLTVFELTDSVFGPSMTRARIESVRRAMKALAAAGVLELDYMPEMTPVRATGYAAGDGQIQRRRYYGDRNRLCAHLTLSVEEREHLNEWLDALVEIDSRIADG